MKIQSAWALNQCILIWACYYSCTCTSWNSILPFTMFVQSFFTDERFHNAGHELVQIRERNRFRNQSFESCINVLLPLSLNQRWWNCNNKGRDRSAGCDSRVVAPCGSFRMSKSSLYILGHWQLASMSCQYDHLEWNCPGSRASCRNTPAYPIKSLYISWLALWHWQVLDPTS